MTRRRLKEAIAKVQKAISEGRSEPPVPIRDPFVYVSDEKVTTVIGGKQPEPQDVNIDELQLVHHAAQGPGPKQEPVPKIEKERRVRRVVRAIVLQTHSRSQVKGSGKARRSQSEAQGKGGCGTNSDGG